LVVLRGRKVPISKLFQRYLDKSKGKEMGVIKKELEAVLSVIRAGRGA